MKLVKYICFVVGTDNEVYDQFIRSAVKNKILILRGSPFHYNFNLLSNLSEEDEEETLIYTNDETMLNYCHYDDKIHNYHIDFLFDNDPHWYTLAELHPNLREVNNITKMFQSGIFFDDYLLMHPEYK